MLKNGCAGTRGAAPDEPAGKRVFGGAETVDVPPLRALLLTVRNHPGVMSHVCGLFARRAFNLEGIMVTPDEDGSVCKMWLMVNEDNRMEQVVRQVRKLHDVVDVTAVPVSRDVFARMAESLRGVC